MLVFMVARGSTTCRRGDTKAPSAVFVHAPEGGRTRKGTAKKRASRAGAWCGCYICRAVPSSSQVAGSFSTVDALVGRGTIQPVNANEPLTETKLAPVEAGAGLPPSIPPGMRALAVRVNDVIGVAGYTVPGTRVDVLVTLSRGDMSRSRAVVSNVQVLTAGTFRDQEQAKDGKPIPSTVVTLMVTPDDAERITLAQSMGSIMLVLRNPLDVVPTDTRGVGVSGLLGIPDAPPIVKSTNSGPRVVSQKPKPEPPLVVPSPTYQVETFKAGKKASEEVGKSGEAGNKPGEAGGKSSSEGAK